MGHFYFFFLLFSIPFLLCVCVCGWCAHVGVHMWRSGDTLLSLYYVNAGGGTQLSGSKSFAHRAVVSPAPDILLLIRKRKSKNDKCCHSVTAPSMLVLYLLSVLCKGFLVVSVHLVSSSLVEGCSCLWSSEDAAGPACFLLERTLTSAVSTEAGLLLGYPSRMGWYLIADFLLGTAGLCLPSVVLTVFMWVATQHQTKQRPIKVPESNPRGTQVEPQGHVESLYSAIFNNHISNYYQDFFFSSVWVDAYLLHFWPTIRPKQTVLSWNQGR